MAKRMLASQVDDSEWQIVEEENQEYQVIGKAYRENYANLFQAAPEMYEALKRIPQQRHGSFEDGWTVFLTGYQMKAIEDILLKAEGREG